MRRGLKGKLKEMYVGKVIREQSAASLCFAQVFHLIGIVEGVSLFSAEVSRKDGKRVVAQNLSYL